MERTPTAISIGRYTVISSGCVLRPPGRNSGGTWRYYGMKVGDNVFVGKDRPCYVWLLPVRRAGR